MRLQSCCWVTTVIVGVFLTVSAVAQQRDICFTNPSLESCASFAVNETEIQQLLNKACSAGNGWPNGCSLEATCGAASSTDGLCSPLALFLLTCEENSAADGCSEYQSLCQKDSKVVECQTAGKLLSMPTADTLYQATINMCDAMPGMTGCDTCTAPKPAGCPDPLKSISTVCLGMWMTGCEEWKSACASVENNTVLYDAYCVAPSSLSSSTQMDMGNATMSSNDNTTMSTPSSTSVSSSDACISDPTQASCKGYTMPDSQVTTDLDGLCASMPNMVGCSLRTACVNGTANGEWCAPFTLLGTICEEMSTMKACSNYNSLCSTPGSVVQQCVTQKPIPNAPTTEQARNSVLTMCGDHSMVGCDTCTSVFNCPHPFDTLSTICLGMPDMSGCNQFFSMCQSTGQTYSELCGGSQYQGLPPMRMWLHTGITDIVLIKEWVPRTGAAYFGTLVACFAAAILVQWLKAFRIQQELTWASQRPLLPCRNSTCGGRIDDPKSDEDRSSSDPIAPCCGSAQVPEPYWKRHASRVKKWNNYLFGWCSFTKNQFKRNMVRSCFTGIVIFFDYMLMLIVMTFNIGIIVAVVFGYMVGSLFLGHVGEKAGSSVSTGGASVAVDPDNDLEVRFMEPPSCCGSTQIV